MPQGQGEDRRKLDYAGPRSSSDYNTSGDRFNPGCLVIFVAAASLVAAAIFLLALQRR